MASAYTNSYKYRDPEKLDISVLGNAMQYKQKNYDTNVAQTQQLINQYAGTDLLREVDKQYFGERLNTLVNYVNQSGTRDWSRRSIANELQSYVSTALDKNVMTAIASTQSYIKQMAEIEDIKKNKPDQYSMQNEWFATRDMERYIRENKIGDSYRAQSYTPYTDVTQTILKNADFYKQFGAEVRYDSLGGNAYFTYLGKTETLSPQEASNLVAMSLGDKGRNQLMIEGLYNYKGVKDDNVVRNDYVNSLTSQKNNYNSLADSTLALAAGASKKEKEVLLKNAQQYKDKAGQLENSIQESPKLNRDKMIYDMHTSNFLNQWGNALSYKKVTDLTIDDSGYKAAKFSWDVKADIWEQNFKNNKEIADNLKWEEEMSLKSKIAFSEGKIDENGNAIVGGANPNIITTEDPEKLGKTDPIDPVGIVNEFNRNYTQAASTVKTDIEKLKSTEAGMRKLQEVFGNEANQPTDRLTFLLMGRNQIAQERYSDLKKSNILSPQSIAAIDKGQESFSKKLYLDKQIKDIDIKVENMTKSFVGQMKGIYEPVVDKDGNVKTGGYGNDGNTNYDNLYGYSKIGAKLNMIGRILKDSGNKMSDLEKQQLVVLRNNLIAKLPKSQREIAENTFGSTGGFWSATGNLVSSQWADLKSTYYNVKQNVFGGDDQDRKLENENRIIAERDNSKFKRDRLNWSRNISSEDGNISDFGSQDLGKNWAGLDKDGYAKNGSSLLNELSMAAKDIDQNLQTYKTTYSSNVFTVNTGDKTAQNMVRSMQALVPDQVLASDSSIQFRINPETGTANVSMMIKGDKGSVVPYQLNDVKIENLPAQISGKLNVDAQRFRYDPVANPEPDPFYFRGDIYDSREEINNRFGSDDMNAFQNHSTKTDIYEKVKAVMGDEFLQRNAEKIQKLTDDSVKFSGKAIQGQYAVDITASDGTFLKREILDSRDVLGQKNLIEKASDKIASEAIVEHIIRTMK